jgi:hypothetical protein
MNGGGSSGDVNDGNRWRQRQRKQIEAEEVAVAREAVAVCIITTQQSKY